jgi:hypothetical protein
VGGVLVAAITTSSITTSLVLSSFAIPICFFLLIAYRKEVYFENIASESIEAIEANGGVKHIQYDTFPQKSDAANYVTHYPKRGSMEHMSIHTIMTVLLMTYNLVAAGAFVCSASKSLLFYASIGIAVGAYPVLYCLSLLMNKGNRIGQSFRATSTCKDGVELIGPNRPRNG